MGGWLHSSGRLTAVQPLAVKARPIAEPTRNFAALIARWRKEKAGELESFAATLGVQQQDLVDLHTAWAPEYRAFAFPMYDSEGFIVGIRLRGEQYKWSVKGSHPGLFVPYNAIRRMSLDFVLITEGPTDTAAGLTLGLFSIGRPACRGCEQLVVDVLKDLGAKNIVLVYDNDEHYDKRGVLVQPGVKGADTLRKMIPWPFKVSKFIPPTKDLREFLTMGGTKDLFLSMVRSAVRA